ncbi:hypothetical protein Salat_1105200 [Sesamum alatum]|uniref:Uncharacterized protein n=1 Tax=Sesamum alatum TaxID=300844 RepID=A0AAE2CTC8_9LAMI|nr:hypothetical protein Salat_1105200 [Sesamum alatum]
MAIASCRRRNWSQQVGNGGDTESTACEPPSPTIPVVRDVLVYVELLGELDTGHGNGGLHDDGVDDMGRLEESVDVDEDAGLVDSDYGISTEVGDDDNIFEDNVDDSITDKCTN